MELIVLIPGYLNKGFYLHNNLKLLWIIHFFYFNSRLFRRIYLSGYHTKDFKERRCYLLHYCFIHCVWFASCFQFAGWCQYTLHDTSNHLCTFVWTGSCIHCYTSSIPDSRYHLAFPPWFFSIFYGRQDTWRWCRIKLPYDWSFLSPTSGHAFMYYLSF